MGRNVLALILVAALVSPSGLPGAQQETSEKAEARRLLIEASHLVKDIPESQQPSAAANISGQLVRAGDLPDALATARSLKAAEDQALANGSIAWQLAHGGDFTQALALIENTVEGQTRGVDYEQLADLRAETGDLKGALQIARRIRNDPDRLVDTLVRVASRRAKVGDPSGARAALGDALKVAEEALRENASHAVELTEIATTQSEIGDAADASITLDRFSQLVHQLGATESNGVSLQRLASAQAQIGDLASAQRTLEDISRGHSDLAWMFISQEQARQGLMADALENAARISNLGFRASTLREIAIISGTHGSLNDAVEAINQIPLMPERAEALATLALEQAENENPEASGTLQLAWKLATEMGADPSGHALGTIAVTRAILGDFAGAQQIVREMSMPEARVWPLWNITSFMVRAGHTQEALALAEEQDAAHPKAYALLGVAEGILSRLEAEQKTLSARH